MRDLVSTYEKSFESGYQLAVMPISRVQLEWIVDFPEGLSFFPSGDAILSNLNCIENRESSPSLAEHCSAATGVDLTLLKKHSLVVFPAKFEWEILHRADHRSHIRMIRRLSEFVDRACLDFVRFRQCELSLVDTLPGRAGSLSSDSMFAAALLYEPAKQASRIIAGAAFSHSVIKGIGLSLELIDPRELPKSGEVGQIVRRALRLYSEAMEAMTHTSRFVQCLSLMEFLADPEQFQSFKETAKIIARYLVSGPQEYNRLLNRFYDLTGRTDPDSKELLGYRTRIVHNGERIEDILESDEALKTLFEELDGYISPIIEHLVQHSTMLWSEYLRVRGELRPFDTANQPGRVV